MNRNRILLIVLAVALLGYCVRARNYRRAVYDLERRTNAVSNLPDTSECVRIIGKKDWHTDRPPRYQQFWRYYHK